MMSGPSNAQIMAAFETMLITHKRADAAHQVFDTLREAKRLSPDSPKSWVALFAPTYSGKSKTIRLYMEKVVDEAIVSSKFPSDMPRRLIAKAQKTVINLSLLSSHANEKSLIALLLTALGDPLAEKGTTREQLQRSYDLMGGLGTELVFIDEMQHLSAAMRERNDGRTGSRFSTAVPNLVKTLLNNGNVPIVCVGVPPGKRHLMGHDELASRCYRDLDYSPIQVESSTMEEVFAVYCLCLAEKLVEHGLFPDLSDFLSDDIPQCLQEVARGKIGDVSRLVQRACEHASARGARCVERRDLEMATDTWAIPAGLIGYNPFRASRMAA